MAVPEVIPIAYEPNHRTDTIGRYTDGQFLATVTYAFPTGFRPDDGWEDHKRLYAVLHTFDSAGHHRDAQIWCAGTWSEQQRDPYGDQSVVGRARAHLTKLLSSLPGLSYTDIAVRPFQLTYDNVLFGLVVDKSDAEDTEDDDWAELLPDGLGFGSPWKGQYDI
ncbi:hypothetical protein [Streptomyces sp. NPDC005423]|uniref:hypothetical protein n=1 Tax=Streptomyces sp. NPDC005423 TaxID=3155343 RepID=UPI0033AD4B94